MPNWCFNSVTIKVKRAEDIQEIISAVRNEGLFRHFVPWTDEVRKDRDLEMLYGGNGLQWRKEHNIPDGGLDWKEAGYSECPYKQMWYRRQCENWGAKRDFQEENFTPDNEGELEIGFSYDSPWNPHLEGRKRLSEKLQCEIWLSFDEPGNCFSGDYHWIEGELVQCDDYDDAYYGNGKDCEICGCQYDLSNPDDWYELADYVGGTGKRNICYLCGEELESKK